MPSDGIVHVIDDDDAMRESLAFLFDTAGVAVQLYDSATTFLQTAAPDAAGCIVTDVRMPEMSGLDLLRELRARGIAMPVVVITGHGDVPLAVEAMQAGAMDFLEKPFDDERLLAAVERALSLGSAEGPVSEEQAEARRRVGELSRRERQVLRRLVEGQLNKTIAFDLGISARTVEVYRAKLMSKMQAGAFADLVRLALLAGRIED